MEHKYSEIDSSNWIEIYQKEKVPGFVHESRIVNILNFKKSKQYNLIDSLFNLEIRILNNTVSTEELFANRTIDYEEIYTPILDLFIRYTCKYKNEKLLKKFIDIINRQSGSAYEAPFWALGAIYICQTDLVLKYLKEFNNEQLYNNLEFGFLNVTSGRETEIKNYIELKRKIQELTTADRQ